MISFEKLIVAYLLNKLLTMPIRCKRAANERYLQSEKTSPDPHVLHFQASVRPEVSLQSTFVSQVAPYRQRTTPQFSTDVTSHCILDTQFILFSGSDHSNNIRGNLQCVKLHHYELFSNIFFGILPAHCTQIVANQLHGAQPDVAQLIKKLPAVYITRKLVPAFARTRYWTLS
jgi:hypothetical protein